MGRPKSEVRQLKKAVTVRFTEEDLEDLIQAAHAEGVSVPRLLRETGLEVIRGRRQFAAVS